MKKSVFQLVVILFFLIGCIEYKSQINDKNDTIESYQTTVSKADFRSFLLGEKTTQKGEPVPLFTIETEADYVNTISPGCYSINVRVYLVGNGMRTLVANQDVNVGDCNNASKIGNTQCTGILPDGNSITVPNKDSMFCLYEILTKNEKAYLKYRVTVEELKESIK